MNNEVNEVGEYLLHHLLLRLFCWKKLGENEVFTAINLTAMGLTRNPPPDNQQQHVVQGIPRQARDDRDAHISESLEIRGFSPNFVR
jgi:hypothetical protein